MFSGQDLIKPYEVAFLKAMLKRRLGIDLSGYKDQFIKRRVYARMLTCNVRSVSRYLRLLERSVEERKSFLDALSINVSCFFRDSYVWETVKEKVLRKVIEDKIWKKGRIQIWSAGCSHGQEPYTIAILLLELAKELGTLPPVTIYATDIDGDALERAKTGVYPPSEVRNVPPQLLRAYFRWMDGKYKVRDDVKGFVRFRRHDLITQPPLRFSHVIFYRNVQIYLSKECQLKVLRNFYTSLNPPGYLILGTSETISEEAKDLFEPVSTYARIYKKKARHLV